MKLNIKELAAKGSPIILQERFDLSELLHERVAGAVFGQLEVNLTAVSSQGITDVEGTLSLPYDMPCSRCLTPAKETIVIPFQERFVQKAELVPSDELEDVHLTNADHIELNPYVEEAVWLALPYAPVCKEDCQGLCPECGHNLNLGTCSCKTDKIDPRLAGLADFFKS